jgi:ATP-binding cassette subfamily F protein uup
MKMNFLLILVWIQVVSFFQPSIAWTTTSTTTGSRQTSLIHLYGAAISTDGTSAAISSAPVLSVENLSCTHNGGETYQLRNVDFNLQRGAKAALIGRNGTGKSTLLKILHESYLFTNNITPSSTSDYKYTGKIQIPKTIRISMVDQEPPAPADVTVGDAILGINKDYDVFASSISASKNVMDVVRRYVVLSKYVADNVGNDEADNANLFVEASADMDMFNGWDILTLSEEIVTKLKVRHLQDEPLTSLSGGERKRVALCAALVESPDVLLLDEPTNFLSLAGVEWLSDLLTEKKSDLTILMVTHDRAFLQQTCDRIVELDRGSLYEHPGSYSTYLQAKEERLAVEDAAIQSAKSKYKIELEWMRRQPQARESKSKSRIDAFYKLEKATKPRPHDPNLNLVEISDGSTRRIGSTIVSMKGVSLSFRSAGGEGHRKMLDDFSYDFCFGDRIWFVN